jgi:nuclear transport factor 2 (NTF2) superfamily protein
MTTPNPPVIRPPFDEASGLMRRRDASINDYPIAAFGRRIALP